MSTEPRPDQFHPPADLRPDTVAAMLAAALKEDPNINPTPEGILRGLVEYGPVWAENPSDPRGQLLRIYTGMLSQRTQPEGRSDG